MTELVDAKPAEPELARILSAGGSHQVCTVLGRSEDTIRIAAGSGVPLPDRFAVELFSSGEVVSVAVASQQADEVSLVIEAADADGA